MIKVVCHDLEVFWIRILKSASRSIRCSLFNGYPIRRKTEEHNHYRSFAVVRNPITRFASGAAMFCKHSPDALLDNLLNDAITPNRETSAAFAKLHTMPMTHPLYEISEGTKIFRFEDLGRGLKDLAEFVGVSPVPELLHLGERTNQIELTTRHVDRIKEIFAEDFARFGYKA